MRKFIAIVLLALVGCNCSTSNTVLKRETTDDPAALIPYAVQVDVSYFPNVVVPTSDGTLPPKTLDHGWGSGCVIRASAGRSLVLTANHVCAFGDLSRTITVMRVNGEVLSAKIVWQDPRTDLCVLSADGYAGPAASVAEAVPPLGALVYFVGGPLGIFGDGVAFLDQAHFAGLAHFSGVPAYFLAGITAHGASGSGVFYRGELIGVLRGVMTQAGYIIVAADLDAVQRAVQAGYSSDAR